MCKRNQVLSLSLLLVCLSLSVSQREIEGLDSHTISPIRLAWGRRDCLRRRLFVSRDITRHVTHTVYWRHLDTTAWASFSQKWYVTNPQKFGVVTSLTRERWLLSSFMKITGAAALMSAYLTTNPDRFILHVPGAMKSTDRITANSCSVNLQ